MCDVLLEKDNIKSAILLGDDKNILYIKSLKDLDKYGQKKKETINTVNPKKEIYNDCWFMYV